MKWFVTSAFALALIALLGCASTPNVTVTYYLPKGSLQVTLVRTVGCAEKTEDVVVATTVLAKGVYERDPNQPIHIPIKSLDGILANSDVSFALTEDGRLTGLNVAQSGQGGEIVKAAVAIAGTVAAFGFEVSKLSGADIKKACDLVRGKDHAISLTFSAEEHFDKRLTSYAPEFHPDPETAGLYEELKPILGEVALTATLRSAEQTERAAYEAPRWWQICERSVVELPVVQPALFDLNVTEKGRSGSIWSGEVSIPQAGLYYSVVMPTAAVFGNQKFAIGLAESGAITSIQYAKDNGLSSALGAASSVLSEFKPGTPADEAAKLKAKADVIAQQQRLVRCQIDPKGCT